jgi:hypothetical protein
LLERAAHAGRARRHLLALLPRAVVGNLAGACFVINHRQAIARVGRTRETKHFYRRRWSCSLHSIAGIGNQRSHPTPFRARHHNVARVQGPALNEDGCDRAAAAIELRLNHGAFGRAIWIGLEVEDFRLQADHFEQLVDIRFLDGGDFDVHHLTAHRFHLDLMLQKVGADAIGLCVGLSILLMATMIGTLRGLGMMNGLDRLRHHAVIGGDNEYNKVGDLGAARRMAGETRLGRAYR